MCTIWSNDLSNGMLLKLGVKAFFFDGKLNVNYAQGLLLCARQEPTVSEFVLCIVTALTDE